MEPNFQFKTLTFLIKEDNIQLSRIEFDGDRPDLVSEEDEDSAVAEIEFQNKTVYKDNNREKTDILSSSLLEYETTMEQISEIDVFDENGKIYKISCPNSIVESIPAFEFIPENTNWRDINLSPIQVNNDEQCHKSTNASQNNLGKEEDPSKTNNDNNKESYPNICFICKNVYASTSSLCHHKKDMHSLQESDCRWCDSKFRTRHDRAVHEQICIKSRSFKCGTCKLPFPYKSYLKRHYLRNPSHCKNLPKNKHNKS